MAQEALDQDVANVNADANANESKEEKGNANDANAADNGADDNDVGGLDDGDEDEITLVSGGQDPKSYKIKKSNVKLANLVVTMLSGDQSTTEVACPQVPSATLKLIVDYLNHHGGKAPEPLPCPVRSVDMKQICSDEFDAKFIDDLKKKEIFEIILAANYLDIPSLLHLGCAKIATLIKQLDQKEINKIIEEEERYRREHAQQNEENNANANADSNQDDQKAAN